MASREKRHYLGGVGPHMIMQQFLKTDPVEYGFRGAGAFWPAELPGVGAAFRARFEEKDPLMSSLVVWLLLIK